MKNRVVGDALITGATSQLEFAKKDAYQTLKKISVTVVYHHIMVLIALKDTVVPIVTSIHVTVMGTVIKVVWTVILGITVTRSVALPAAFPAIEKPVTALQDALTVITVISVSCLVMLTVKICRATRTMDPVTVGVWI